MEKGGQYFNVSLGGVVGCYILIMIHAQKLKGGRLDILSLQDATISLHRKHGRARGNEIQVNYLLRSDSEVGVIFCVLTCFQPHTCVEPINLPPSLPPKGA